MKKTMIITGGAGFIGVNAALYFSKHGWQITVVDNLSRRGTEMNLCWLKEQTSVDFEKVDIRDHLRLQQLAGNIRPEVMLHLAAQVAVTTSVIDPRDDFENNALGTLNVLEAVRLASPDTFVINASTNKVYGKMSDVGVEERSGRYEYRSLPGGVDENRQLDFHSPYGCSKGVADQYTIDYARIYDLRTTTFRQSCIYGPRQFGIEDQGWVAWFIIAAVLNKQITIYGNGKQIRDVLHVHDLIRCYEAAINRQNSACGQAFNIGGGPDNTLSLLELLSLLEQELSIKIPLQWDDWRPGDQPVFVCNIDKAKKKLDWEAAISVRDGAKQLIAWVNENKELFSWLK